MLVTGAEQVKKKSKICKIEVMFMAQHFPQVEVLACPHATGLGTGELMRTWKPGTVCIFNFLTCFFNLLICACL